MYLDLQYNRLDFEDEVKLYKAMKDGDLEARGTLIASVLPLALEVAKTYYGNKGFEPDDIAQEAFISVMYTVDHRYDASGLLYPFAKKALHWDLLKYIRVNRSVIRLPQDPRPTDAVSEGIIKYGVKHLDCTYDDVEDTWREIEWIAEAIEELPSELIEVARLRYIDGKLQREVCEILNLSAYHVAAREQAIIKTLRRLI